MAILLYLKQFLHDLRAQRLRTFLTIMGLAWGTVTVICLLAFGYGLQKSQEEAFIGLGDQIVIMWSRRTSKPFMGYPKGRSYMFHPEDEELLRKNIPEIKYVTGEFQRWNINFAHGRKSQLVAVHGVNADFGLMRNLIPEPGGRFINDPDYDVKKRVVFIGNELRDQIFGEGTDPVGKAVMIDGVPFTVIGVMTKKKQDSSYSGQDAEKAFIPATTFQAKYGDPYLDNLVWRAQDRSVHLTAKNRVYEVIGKKYKFDPADEEAIAMWDTLEGQDFMLFFVALRWFVGFVGFMTLLVGGIGLANIMYVVVEERTKEIGIKMSLGAKKNFVLFGIVFETFLLVAIGGGIGYMIASGIIAVAQNLNLEDYVGNPVLSFGDRMVIITILGFIGFLASYFPARRAANMNPVQALKL